MKIPFDSLSLSCIVAEAQILVGGKLDRFVQPNGQTIVFGVFGENGGWLLISADPQYSRAHLVSRRPEGLKPVPVFATECRKYLNDGTIVFVRQRGLDRILEIGVQTELESYQIVAELMGKHSNVMVVRSDLKVIAALKWVGAAKSVRPVLPGQPYTSPPFPSKTSLLQAKPDDNLLEFEGVSPFLAKLIGAGTPLSQVQHAVRDRTFRPVFSPGNGAYPISVKPFGVDEVPRPSLSFALEQHFDWRIEQDALTTARRNLSSQLERVLLAREVAIRDVHDAVQTAKDARRIQTFGELILAYQGQINPGDTQLEAYDYEGEIVNVALKKDLTVVENADRYFQKAKRAKARAGEMESQWHRLESDRQELTSVLKELSSAQSTSELQPIHELAEKKRWLQKSGQAKPKEERPFEGHAVRELLSPGGWRVLYGDNSTSNDYLTSKVARPSDLWFHVRGAPSAHVVLCTNNQPNKVQKVDIEFAAKVAVAHSPTKHASYVSVDFTQKRYVRKPRGSAPGLAVYTNEKTIHVTSD